MMQEEYQQTGPGPAFTRTLCVQCHTPLPFEPDLVRRIKMSLEGPITSWAVRRCHVCGASNVQALDHLRAIEDEPSS
jgi:RNase P subunit RPR2